MNDEETKRIIDGEFLQSLTTENLIALAEMFPELFDLFMEAADEVGFSFDANNETLVTANPVSWQDPIDVGVDSAEETSKERRRRHARIAAKWFMMRTITSLPSIFGTVIKIIGAILTTKLPEAPPPQGASIMARRN